jgi:hypothetical protein
MVAGCLIMKKCTLSNTGMLVSTEQSTTRTPARHPGNILNPGYINPKDITGPNPRREVPRDLVSSSQVQPNITKDLDSLSRMMSAYDTRHILSDLIADVNMSLYVIL